VSAGSVPFAAAAFVVLIPFAPVRAEETSAMSPTPPRIVVPGLGRLPVFSHASTAGGLIFVSGTLGTLPGSMKLAAGGIGPETTQTLENLKAILAAAGASLADVVKVSVFLADLADFAAMNEAYAAFFPSDPPARITVGGAQLALGARVEMECVARAPGAP
jgi:2-iminobutanoate/2-iminopropanoate deaminase